MISLALCLVAFISTLWAGKRSLGQGLISLLFWGYFFGIIRANLLSTASYFVFDAALLGFYLSQKGLFSKDSRTSTLHGWFWVLTLWPCLLIVMPFQPFLVSLVGLRGSVLFLPMMLAGSRLRGSDLREYTFGFAALNMVALCFAGGEYFLGLERFFPHNAATILIYGSNDVAGGFNRIPAIFANAHLYGGTMAASVPFLIAGWEVAQARLARWFILGGLGAAFLGVLLSATRLNFAICGALSLLTVLNGRMSPRKRAVIVLVIVAMVGVAMRNTRFQRFKSLSDTDYVQDRISGSVNRSFFEILLEYPLGNGLGGGGTSIPYFLQGQVRKPIGLENEYARILCEQGIIGLALWLGFVTWFLSRLPRVFAKGPWATGRRLVWCLSVAGLGIGAIGMGMLTAVPQSAILLLGIGWTATPMAEESRARQVARATPAGSQRGGYYPVPTLESR
jgi:O-Antigen ligase